MLREGPVLNLEEAWREDAGRYVCVARSGAEQREGTSFTLHVQYVAVRAAQEKVVMRTEERRARLTCYVEGYPNPQVSWYRSSGMMTEGATHRFIASAGVHHLEIDQVTPDDLGEYQCYVHNGVSRDLATVTLTASPAEARILEVQPTPRPEIFNVTWVVESVAPLRLYVMEYLKKDAAGGQWNTTYIGVSEQPRGMTYVQSGLVTLDLSSTYEMRVRGVTQDNQQGPDMTQPFEITTGGGASAKIAGLFRTSLPILSRFPAFVRGVLQ